METTRGQIADELLVATSGVIDGPDDFRIFREWRLKDEPAVALLRQYQFSATTWNQDHSLSWSVCPDCTGSREGGHTASCRIAAVLREADVRAAEVVRRDEGVMFVKANGPCQCDNCRAGYLPDADGCVTVEDPPGCGQITRVPAAELVMRHGVDEDDRSWVPWVTYTRVGEDRPIHRTAHAFGKKVPGFNVGQVGFVNGLGT